MLILTPLIISAIMTISPWLLGYKGMVFGMPFSIRSLSNILAAGLGVFGLGLIVAPSLQQKAKHWVGALEALDKQKKMRWVLYLTVLYVVPVISHKLKAHASLDTHALDLGFFSNICWNTAFPEHGGGWFYCSLIERNFMSIHVNWILWPLSFFYAWGGDARVLLVAQAVIMATALPFLWLLAERLTGSFTAALIACVLFVCSPHVAKSISNDFHPDVWQVPCLMAALWLWHRQSKSGVLAAGLLALLAKEDVSFVLAGFSILLMMSAEWRKTGALMFVLSVGAFLFHALIFIPHFLTGDMESLLFTRYPLLGDGYGDMARNLFTSPVVYLKAVVYDPMKYWRLLKMTFPVAGLVFLAPWYLIPVFVSAAPHLLSQAPTQLQLADIYALPLQPFIFAGAAAGAGMILQRRWPVKRLAVFVGCLFVIAGIGAGTSSRFYKAETKERLKSFAEVKRLVPSHVSLATQQNLYPHFDTRRLIQLFPTVNSFGILQAKWLLNPDYILADRIGNTIPFSRAATDAAIASVEKDERYLKLYDNAGFVLFKRRTEEMPQWKAHT